MDQDQTIPTFISRRELTRRLGVGTTTLDRMIRSGEFPPPARIGLRRVAWPLPEVEAWIAARLSERAEQPAG